MLNQEIEIVRSCGLQVGIAERDALGTRVRIDDLCGDQVTDVGSRNADAVIRAKICIFLDLILDLNAGQRIEIAGALAKRGNQRVSVGIDHCCVYVMGCKVGGGSVKTDTRLKAKLPDGNRVLYVSGGDALVGVEEGALRLLDAC